MATFSPMRCVFPTKSAPFMFHRQDDRHKAEEEEQDWRAIARASRRYRVQSTTRPAPSAEPAPPRPTGMKPHAPPPPPRRVPSSAPSESTSNASTSVPIEATTQNQAKPKSARPRPPPPPPPPRRSTPTGEENVPPNACNRGSPCKTPMKPTAESAKPETPKFRVSSNIVAPTPIATKPPAPRFAAMLGEGKLSYYEMLQISSTATEREISKAWKGWCKVTHPDHNRSETANEDFQALQQIYGVLKNPVSRMAYGVRRRYATAGRR